MILLPLFIGKEINLFPFKKGTQAAKDQDRKKSSDSSRGEGWDI